MRSQVGSIKSSVVLRASTACLIALSVSACSSDTMRFTETPFDSPFKSARLSSQPVRDPVTTGSINPAPVAPVQSAPLSAPVASQPLPPPQSAVALRDSVQPLPAYGGAQSSPAPAPTPRVAQSAPEPRFVPGPPPAVRQAAAPVVDARARAQAAAEAKAKAEADAAAMRESRARFAAEAKARAEARKTAAATTRAAAPVAQPAPARPKPVEVASAPAATRPSAAPSAAPRTEAPAAAPQAAQPMQDPKTTASLPKAEAAAASEKADFRWPARGRVIAGFSGRGGNEGINIAVPEGTPVRAAESGTVAYAGSELKGYGNLVLIRHSNGYVSAYAHNGELKVKRGDTVKRGQVVASSGQTGNVSSPQLHFELRKGAAPVDPTPYLNN